MKSFIIKNWVGMFLLLLVLSLSFLGWIAIEINDGLANFLEKTEGDDKRMDVIGSIFGTSVAIASAFVAIILARTALLFAENEEKREFKNKIEERVKDINKTSHKITLEARKIGVNVMNHFEQLNDSSFKNDFVKSNLLKYELKKIKDELNKIQGEALFFMVYKNNSDNFLNEIKNCIKLFEKPKSYSIFSCNNNEVNCINLQLDYQNKLKEYQEYKEYKKLNNFNKDSLFKVLNNIENGIKNSNYIKYIYCSGFWEMRKEIIEKFKKYEKFTQEDYLIWLNLFIFLSLFTNSDKEEVIVDPVEVIVDPVRVIDIFINLPDTHNFINFSYYLDKEFWKTNKEYAIETICILSENTNDNLKTLLIEIRNFFIDLQEKDLSYIIEENNNQEINQEKIKVEAKKETNFEKFKNLIKGVAIKNNQKEINANVIFTAMSYLDLSAYGKAVFSKMMGDHFYGIEPATGGQEYIDLADSKREINIPLDVNMKIFVDEVKKHLGNKDFFTIR